MHLFHSWGKYADYATGTSNGWPVIILKRVCLTCGKVEFKTIYS